MSEQRTRTYTWENPDTNVAARRGLSGLAYLQKMVAGEVDRPPIGYTLDFQLIEVEEGRAVFLSRPEEYHYNPMGSVHGGYFGTLLDSAMGCAIQTTLGVEEAHTTLEYKINLVRPLRVDTGEIRTEGWIVHRGSRMATAEGRIVDGAGKVYAHGSATSMIFAARSREGGD